MSIIYNRATITPFPQFYIESSYQFTKLNIALYRYLIQLRIKRILGLIGFIPLFIEQLKEICRFLSMFFVLFNIKR